MIFEPQLFYSRRIGRAPQAPAPGTHVDTPTTTTILGAAKLTGKTPSGWSLALLDALHARWGFLLERMQPADFQRPLRHPEHERKLTLDMMLAMYAWHGKHHAAHITRLRERETF